MVFTALFREDERSCTMLMRSAIAPTHTRSTDDCVGSIPTPPLVSPSLSSTIIWLHQSQKKMPFIRISEKWDIFVGFYSNMFVFIKLTQHHPRCCYQMKWTAYLCHPWVISQIDFVSELTEVTLFWFPDKDETDLGSTYKGFYKMSRNLTPTVWIDRWPKN